MYKPPENTNRVKAIKSKFENNNLNKQQENINGKQLSTLSRQLSDPVKVNIKRTPAFRNDKQFQRNGSQVSCRIKGNENKKNCDRKSASPKKNSVTVSNSTSFSNLRKRFDSQEDLSKIPPQNALRERSNTSAEIILSKHRNMCKENKKCFDSQENLNKTLQKTSVKILDIPKTKEDARYENIAFLYSEPVPKALRHKEDNNVHNVSTLKIGDKLNQCSTDNLRNIQNAGTSKVSGIDDVLNFKLNALTDTLKLALKKPLPPGPAPKKPPRTFAHASPNLQIKGDFEKRLNISLQKGIEQRSKRGDPKYMLDKLENALKNNKIRLRRAPKIDYTSEEDNCEADQTKSKLNFNCLQSLSCSNATYESIGEPKSEFFIGSRKEEPVYAEPFVFPRGERGANIKSDDKKLNRNSLYYMSTPVIAANEVSFADDMDYHGLQHSDAGDETSSLSTPSSSDLDSVLSTPSEERKKFMSSKIKELMKSFEAPPVERRVDKLGSQLRQTLENSFATSPIVEQALSSTPSSTEGESHDDIVGRYGTYVRKIRMITNLCQMNDGNRLFYSCLLVGLDGTKPYIKFKFPPDIKLPPNIEQLCFPDATDSSMDFSLKAQNYSIVVTDNEGKRIYGYCRRVLPEDSQKCLPLAYCIISSRRVARFYRRVLEELESRHGIPDKVRDLLLKEFYYHQFPTPGQSVRFNLMQVNKYLATVTYLDDKTDNNLECNGNNRKSNDSDVDLNSFVLVNGRGSYGSLMRKSEGKPYNKRNGVLFHNGIIPKVLMDGNDLTSISTPTEIVITLHQDSRYKENDLEELCNTLKIDILMKVFASLLLERKVIFISSLLGKLSTCIEAVQNMLYPFCWPHTLISVVPNKLLELVEAPTPLICGVLSLEIDEYVIDNGIVVNLDIGKILREVGDEDKIVPCSLLKAFKEGMSLARASSKENECAFNVLLSDAFLRIFINSCGHYSDFIKDKQFQRDEFIQHPKSKSVRRFLTWFTETTMFCSFIDTVVAKPGSFTIFDRRIEIYSSSDVNLILEKMKDWKKEK